MRVCAGESESMSISLFAAVGGRRFEILKIALSFPGPMPPRNLNACAGEVGEGREMYTAAAVSGGSSMPVRLLICCLEKDSRTGF